MKVTELQYEFAQQRMEALLTQVNNEMASTDERVVELSIMSELVREYEEEHYPLGRPTVGELIRLMLNENDMTQRELAQKINISASRVNDFVCGRADPSLRVSARLCKVLGISPSVIMLNTTPVSSKRDDD